jgi:transcriptional regulator with XRE-family HTH domain
LGSMLEDLVLNRRKFRQLRLDAGLSFRDLSRRCAANGVRVSDTAVGDYERGGYQPSPKVLKALADVLGVRPTELLIPAEVAA